MNMRKSTVTKMDPSGKLCVKKPKSDSSLFILTCWEQPVKYDFCKSKGKRLKPKKYNLGSKMLISILSNVFLKSRNKGNTELPETMLWRKYWVWFSKASVVDQFSRNPYWLLCKILFFLKYEQNLLHRPHSNSLLMSDIIDFGLKLCTSDVSPHLWMGMTRAFLKLCWKIAFGI